MHEVSFHKRALCSLKRIPTARQRQILVAVKELSETEDPTTHRNVWAMMGEWRDHWRMRVGDYRVIFQLRPLESEGEAKRFRIYITHIGTRGDIY